MPIKVLGVLTLILAMSVESFAQMFLKVGAAGGPRVLVSPFRELVQRNRFWTAALSWTAVGILFYVLETALYTLVLHWLDVSVAFPLGSLCFVGVALLSKMFLGESVGRVRWLGVSCILVGTVFIAL